jgi:hypothetical protein
MGDGIKFVPLTYTDRKLLREAAGYRLAELSRVENDGGESYLLKNARNKLVWAEEED